MSAAFCCVVVICMLSFASAKRHVNQDSFQTLQRDNISTTVNMLTGEFRSVVLETIGKYRDRRSQQWYDPHKGASTFKTTSGARPPKKIPSLVRIASQQIVSLKDDLKVLKENDVSQSLQQEIIGMSAGLVPREDIIAHVLTHYPAISSNTASDIVTATHVSAGRDQPKAKSSTQVAQDKALAKAAKFQKLLQQRIANS